MKKVLSLVLALALVLVLAVPAFATSVTDSTATNVDLEAGVVPIPLNVTVPAAIDPKLNPYGLEVTLADGSTKETKQIVSEPMFIKNESVVDVRVDVTAKGTPTAGVTMATATTQNASKPVTTKSVFAYFEIMEAADGTTAPAWAATVDTKAANVILLAAKDTVKTSTVVMGKGNTTETYAAFHIAGDMASAPTTAWTTDDKVNITLAFTFIPTTKAS